MHRSVSYGGASQASGVDTRTRSVSLSGAPLLAPNSHVVFSEQLPSPPYIQSNARSQGAMSDAPYSRTWSQRSAAPDVGPNRSRSHSMVSGLSRNGDVSVDRHSHEEEMVSAPPPSVAYAMEYAQREKQRKQHLMEKYDIDEQEVLERYQNSQSRTRTSSMFGESGTGEFHTDVQPGASHPRATDFNYAGWEQYSGSTTTNPGRYAYKGSSASGPSSNFGGSTTSQPFNGSTANRWTQQNSEANPARRDSSLAVSADAVNYTEFLPAESGKAGASTRTQNKSGALGTGSYFVKRRASVAGAADEEEPYYPLLQVPSTYYDSKRTHNDETDEAAVPYGSYGVPRPGASSLAHSPHGEGALSPAELSHPRSRSTRAQSLRSATPDAFEDPGYGAFYESPHERKQRNGIAPKSGARGKKSGANKFNEYGKFFDMDAERAQEYRKMFLDGEEPPNASMPREPSVYVESEDESVYGEGAMNAAFQFLDKTAAASATAASSLSTGTALKKLQEDEAQGYGSSSGPGFATQETPSKVKGGKKSKLSSKKKKAAGAGDDGAGSEDDLASVGSASPTSSKIKKGSKKNRSAAAGTGGGEAGGEARGGENDKAGDAGNDTQLRRALLQASTQMEKPSLVVQDRSVVANPMAMQDAVYTNYVNELRVRTLDLVALSLGQPSCSSPQSPSPTRFSSPQSALSASPPHSPSYGSPSASPSSSPLNFNTSSQFGSPLDRQRADGSVNNGGALTQEEARIRERASELRQELSAFVASLSLPRAIPISQRPVLEVKYHSPGVFTQDAYWDPFYAFRWWEKGLQRDFVLQHGKVSTAPRSVTQHYPDDGIPKYMDRFGGVTYGPIALHPMRMFMVELFMEKRLTLDDVNVRDMDILLAEHISNPFLLERKLVKQYRPVETVPLSARYNFVYPPQSKITFVPSVMSAAAQSYPEIVGLTILNLPPEAEKRATRLIYNGNVPEAVSISTAALYAYVDGSNAVSGTESSVKEGKKEKSKIKKSKAAAETQDDGEEESEPGSVSKRKSSKKKKKQADASSVA